MIRNETFLAGVCIAAEVIDLDAGTVTVEEHGKPVSTRPLTDEEREQWTPVEAPAGDLRQLVADVVAETVGRALVDDQFAVEITERAEKTAAVERRM